MCDNDMSNSIPSRGLTEKCIHVGAFVQTVNYLKASFLAFLLYVIWRNLFYDYLFSLKKLTPKRWNLKVQVCLCFN